MNKLKEYLNYFLKQKEAGLIIIDTPGVIKEIESQIKEKKLILTNSWQEAIENIRNNVSVCLVLDENFSKNHYDLIAQYFARSGAIQIMDKNTMKLESVQFDPFTSHLLLLVSKENLSKIEKKYSIKDKIGLTERI